MYKVILFFQMLSGSAISIVLNNIRQEGNLVPCLLRVVLSGWLLSYEQPSNGESFVTLVQRTTRGPTIRTKLEDFRDESLQTYMIAALTNKDTWTTIVDDY
ncbi:chaperone protein HtpG [Striga asiatica]|uniref:Chaperone protein HtpG n=1 Tax=Striga asiatica TaxID=4170 RepID=A0A5A7RCY9_STRAF|nr:chaperone protein HtpG [Striga asiatica]